MRAARSLTRTQLPTTRRPGRCIAARDALTALTSGQAEQQSNPEHQNGRARRAIGCMLAGLLIALPIWIFAYVGEHYYWQPHGIVVATAIGVMIIGGIWLYDEVAGD